MSQPRWLVLPVLHPSDKPQDRGAQRQWGGLGWQRVARLGSLLGVFADSLSAGSVLGCGKMAEPGPFGLVLLRGHF